MNENEFVVTLKLNKMMLNEQESQKIFKILKDKMTTHNVLTFYSLAKIYKLGIISESGLLYIERCFPMVVETQNFLHLDFSIVVKILESSELNIHTEVEVFNAAFTWLKHNIEERSKYAKQLLSKIRFTLLSEHAFKYILNEISVISKKNESINMLKTILGNKSKNYQNRENMNLTTRYCNQNKYSILICGGYTLLLSKSISKVKVIDTNNMNVFKDLRSMKKDRRNSKAVYLKGKIYVFGGCNKTFNSVNSIEKYSTSNNKWTVVTNMFEERQYFCACSFMDKIFIFGGYCHQKGYTTISCVQFDTIKENWKTIANMNEARGVAACVVFLGNIVVSGGMDNDNNDLKSVESYDVFADRWTSMPNMINHHYCHSLVSVKNKLFVIDNKTNNCHCEAFDNVSNKFVSLKHPLSINNNKSVSIGNKILVFKENSSSMLCYNVDKDEWSEESCEATKHLKDFSCVKIPSY